MMCLAFPFFCPELFFFSGSGAPDTQVDEGHRKVERSYLC